MDLKRVFASSLRQNMLKELSATREIRVMALVRRVNSTYDVVNRNLALLAEEGILLDEYRRRVRHGKIRVISLNRENPKTKILLQVLETIASSEI